MLAGMSGQIISPFPAVHYPRTLLEDSLDGDDVNNEHLLLSCHESLGVSGISGPTASPSPNNLLEMQIPGPERIRNARDGGPKI